MGVWAGFFDLDHPMVWSVPGFLPARDCAAWIARPTEWLEGTVNGREGRVVRPEVRQMTVAVHRDPAAAAELTKQLLPHLPQRMLGQPLWGVGPTIRIYRYGPEDYFTPHRDQKYRKGGLTSHLALLIYLDEGCEGGATRFLDQDLVFAPEVGRAVLFQNMTLHSGEEVRSGVKHLLRADVMYGVL